MLKKMYQAVSNAPAMEQAAPVPSDMTVEKMVTVVTAFFEASNGVIRSVVEELLAEVRKMPIRDFLWAPCGVILSPHRGLTNDYMVAIAQEFARSGDRLRVYIEGIPLRETRGAAVGVVAMCTFMVVPNYTKDVLQYLPYSKKGRLLSRLESKSGADTQSQFTIQRSLLFLKLVERGRVKTKSFYLRCQTKGKAC